MARGPFLSTTATFNQSSLIESAKDTGHYLAGHLHWEAHRARPQWGKLEVNETANADHYAVAPLGIGAKVLYHRNRRHQVPPICCPAGIIDFPILFRSHREIGSKAHRCVQVITDHVRVHAEVDRILRTARNRPVEDRRENKLPVPGKHSLAFRPPHIHGAHVETPVGTRSHPVNRLENVGPIARISVRGYPRLYNGEVLVADTGVGKAKMKFTAVILYVRTFVGLTVQESEVVEPGHAVAEPRFQASAIYVDRVICLVKGEGSNAGLVIEVFIRGKRRHRTHGAVMNVGFVVGVPQRKRSIEQRFQHEVVKTRRHPAEVSLGPKLADLQAQLFIEQVLLDPPLVHTKLMEVSVITFRNKQRAQV